MRISGMRKMTSQERTHYNFSKDSNVYISKTDKTEWENAIKKAYAKEYETTEDRIEIKKVGIYRFHIHLHNTNNQYLHTEDICILLKK